MEFGEGLDEVEWSEGVGLGCLGEDFEGTWSARDDEDVEFFEAADGFFVVDVGYD